MGRIMPKKRLRRKFIKKITPPIIGLNELFGDDEYFTGLMICFLADAVKQYATDQERNMRKIEITFNNAFSFAYDLEKEDFSYNDKGELVGGENDK